MKILSILLLFVSCIAQGQNRTLTQTLDLTQTVDGSGSIFLGTFDCGEWKTSSDTSEWVTLDTLSVKWRDMMRKFPNSIFNKHREWVYDKIKNTDQAIGTITAEYNPCKGSISSYEQYRICRETGIRQRRTIVNRGFYEKELSAYDKVVKSFKNE